ncbi:MAG TPA: ATP-binding cassette domain-containing protein [Solirubrobacteraceae bacterium]|nr:ATP-binding cassette domain-containing protein [Solirubrobacteraceae bacterium]
MPAAIEAADLHKRYPPAVQALDGVSLTVESGTIFGVLGPNGAGKSTLTRVLCTLTRPDSGSATVAGIDVISDPVKVRRTIGVVGQKHGSDANATGRENLILHGEFYGITGQELKSKVAAALERFELVDAADRQVRTYSGGMARRLDIAMGLLNRPKVLFLDEPTTGLDPEARAQMWTYIASLAADEQMTIWITTHYMDEADALTGKLAIVDRGRIVATGSPDELKRQVSGDALYIELVDPGSSDPASVLERIEGVGEIELDGRLLRARARDGAAALPAVLSALDGQQIGVASVKVSRPSLDDVYLRFAGRAFEQAESEFGEAA